MFKKFHLTSSQDDHDFPIWWKRFLDSGFHYKSIYQINETLIEYNAEMYKTIWGQQPFMNIDTYLKFDTVEGYTEFMLRWG